MAFDIEKDWTTESGLRAVAIMVKNWKHHRCGYVGVPKGHPLHGKDYSDMVPDLPDLPEDEPFGTRGVFSAIFGAVEGGQKRLDVYFNVHGSLTFAGGDGAYPVESDLWWFGFDCNHSGDEDGQPLEYVADQCESLAKQLAKVATLPTEAVK